MGILEQTKFKAWSGITTFKWEVLPTVLLKFVWTRGEIGEILKIFVNGVFFVISLSQNN